LFKGIRPGVRLVIRVAPDLRIEDAGVAAVVPVPGIRVALKECVCGRIHVILRCSFITCLQHRHPARHSVAVFTLWGHKVELWPSCADAATLNGMPGQLRRAQKVFDSTGGLHAAALFGVDGTMLVVREDIGRHNAVDKVIGWALEHQRVPLSATVLLVSGRASFELTQKAVLAGIPVLAAVSAPSSLAVSLAEEFGLTLVAFLREDSMNVYTRADRIT